MEDKEFRIVIVASRFKPEDSEKTYSKIFPGLIRVVDLLHEKDAGRQRFKLIHNGVLSGPLGELFKAVNVLENSMRGLGFYFQRELHKMDILLHGRDTERLWLEDNIKQANAVIILNDGNIRRDVLKVLESVDAYKVEVSI